MVAVLAVARMKSELSKLSNNAAFVAVPANTALLTEALSVIPGYIIGNAANKAASGTNCAPSYTMPTRVLFTYRLVIKRVAPVEFKIVSGMAPDCPCALV